MWSGFSSEIETNSKMNRGIAFDSVACGATSHLRLKLGASSPIKALHLVACGAASHLRLKRTCYVDISSSSEVACGAASHLRLKPRMIGLIYSSNSCRMWSGFSSEIETVLGLA